MGMRLFEDGSASGGVGAEVIETAEVRDREFLARPQLDGVLEGPVLQLLAPGDGQLLLAEVAVVGESATRLLAESGDRDLASKGTTW